MKTNTFVLVGMLAFSLAACSKSEAPKLTATTSRIEAQPFNGQSYRTQDGRSAITLISSDELEYRVGDGTTLLCKYSSQQDALRVIMTALGTQQVLYFRRVPNGLVSHDGIIYLNPSALTEAQRQAELAVRALQEAQAAAERQEAERLRLAAVEAQRRAEEQRLADERAREEAQKHLRADIQALEGTDCSTESLSLSVPESETREFIVDPKRQCWTSWLIGTPYCTYTLNGGDILVQVVFRNGKMKEQIDGPGKDLDFERQPVEKIRFKSLHKEPVKVLFKAHY